MATKANILIVVLDALRAASMSCYGYERETTPGLDDFASRNIFFKHCYTNATWTIPSHASMLSGLYLSQHRLENTQQNRRFHPDIVPLPVALARAGYRTAAFSHNRLFGPAHYFDYFDEFYDLDRWPAKLSLMQGARQRGRWPGAASTAIRYLEKMQRPRQIFDALLAWMEAQEQPFFVMANLTNIHYHWAPPPDLLWRELGLRVRALSSDEMRTLQPWRFNAHRSEVTDEHREVWRRLYDASIRHVDREWSRFFRKLQQQNGYDELVLAVTADHGELLGEYKDIVGHMLSLHDHLLHVPLIVRHPDYTGGLSVDNVVQTVDLYATVLEWAGAGRAAIPEAQLQCPPLSAAMNGPVERVAFAEEDYTDSYDLPSALHRANPAFDAAAVYPERRVAVHDGAHKLIWNNRGKPELYDVIADPGEKHDLAGDSSAAPLLAKLERALEAWERDRPTFPPEATGLETQDPEVIERLRALGYLP
jgi:arylsulfatase A-like enzyme